MKIIFLDIDGVLNRNLMTRDPERPFNPDNLAPFNHIIEQTSAKVVISSSWRTLIGDGDMYKTEDAFFQFLRTEGLVAELIGVTPVLKHVSRGKEIQSWLFQADNIEDYLIFEDNVDDIMPTEHLLKTNSKMGLTWELAEGVIRRFTHSGA